MPDNVLDVFISGTYAGVFTRRGRDAVTFSYDSDYARNPLTTPLSLALPKSKRVHEGDAALRWIANLLPESPQKRARLAASTGSRSDQPFDLIAQIGQDVAGAVQILPAGAAPSSTGDLVERTEADIAAELRLLRQDRDHVTSLFGRWSLAGVQSKIALARVGERWLATTGAAASTHILKMGPGDIPHGDIAEYVTLTAARNIGIEAPRAHLHYFEDQLAVVVERYDRAGSTEAPGQVLRLHQEDMCQALGLWPEQKYQSEGGPDVETIGALLWSTPARTRETSVRKFLQLLVFNALTYSPDAHAKNYSVMLSGPDAYLAPAYDLMSVALLDTMASVRHETKLAMKTGSNRYDADRVGRQQVARCAESLRLDGEEAVQMARAIAYYLRDAFQSAIDSVDDVIGGIAETQLMRERVDELDEVLRPRFDL